MRLGCMCTCLCVREIIWNVAELHAVLLNLGLLCLCVFVAVCVYICACVCVCLCVCVGGWAELHAALLDLNIGLSSEDIRRFLSEIKLSNQASISLQVSYIA
jgi:hypothetical protein